MPYTFAKIPDGEVSLGSMSGSIVELTPSSSDYPGSGGYQIVDGSDVVVVPTKRQNVSLYQVVGVIPVGGQAGYVPVFDPTTNKLAIRQGATGQLTEVATGVDLSALKFRLLLVGF